jgi:hypothetical protein
MTDPEPHPVDPLAPVDYPADYPNPPAYPGYPSLPPPVYAAPYWGPGGYPPQYPPPYPPQYPGQYPGQFGDPYDPYRLTAPAGTNGKAIGALVASLIGLPLCTCFIPSLVGIVLGFITLTETKRTGQQGRGMALAAVIIGLVTLILGALFISLSVATDG